MRAVVQRVSRASVTVGDELVGAVGPGLMVLVGVGREDGPAQAKWLAEKVAGLRIFPDGAGKLNRSVLEAGGEVLAVSQFTLWGDCTRGKRPGFSRAADGPAAEPLYQEFVAALRGLGLTVATGRFGTDMAVSLINDGPVTLLVDSEKTF